MGRYSRLGHDLYTGERSYDFVGRKWLWYAISAVIVVVAIGGLAVRGLTLGIEFTGGAQYTVSLPSSQATQATADGLRAAVQDSGVPGTGSAVATTSGDQAVQVQTETLSDRDSAEVVRTILDTTGVAAADVSQQEIGPSWGAEIAQRALTGIGVFLVLIALGIWAYFREWKMSAAALVALAHDIVITVGIYAIVGFEVTPATVTGVLTILGFSLYDTVVVFDKVRENTTGSQRANRSYAESANLAINQTVVRSVNTSVVALLPVASILWIGAIQLGAGALKDLSLSLFIGMAAGVYSSVFIATPLAVHLKSNEKDVVESDRRAKARARSADRYAAVPAYAEGMPVREQPAELADVEDPDRDADPRDRDDDPRGPARGPTSTGGPAASPEVYGRGRTAPASRGPVSSSSASGRNQPRREPKSKRKR